MNKVIRNLTQQEQLNFLLTNRIPRRLVTHFMGWYSRIQSTMLTRISIAVWKLFANDLNLDEAKLRKFNSLHECFVRELKPGARIVNTNEDLVVSPCDAIVGACGKVEGTRVYQTKGFPYELSELIPEPNLQRKYANGVFVTLRLKSSMYHRFHAPITGKVNAIEYISGDTWNVNPIALKRIEKLYCKNERALVELNAPQPQLDILLVPVAAILVASIKFHCLEKNLDLKYKGPNRLRCDTYYNRGDEMGYFQHGSTIILFSTNAYQLCEHVDNGLRINMGQALLQKC